MQIYQAEYDDGVGDLVSAKSSVSYAAVIEPCAKESKIGGYFKSLASVQDSDLYYTQSILVSSSWNKNDDIFDKIEVWTAKKSPEHKPTNLEHDESTIIGHIVSNWPITEEGILIDENTPLENLPEKYHILTGAVIYKAYTQPELQERTAKLIAEIEGGTKFVSMECFFKGFDYGLINKETGAYKVLARNAETAYLTKYLRAYGGLGEHENYRIGRVLRNITFSGKGYVDRPANPDSIIFTKDNFKFGENTNLEKNHNISKTGVLISQSNINSENHTMSQIAEVTSEVQEVSNEEVATVETVTTQSDEATVSDNSEQSATEVATEVAVEATKPETEVVADAYAEIIKQYKEEQEKMSATIADLETKLKEASDAIAGYAKKEKKMTRKASLLGSGFDSEKADSIVEKFESLSDETFAAMTEMISAKKMDKEKKEEDVKPGDKSEDKKETVKSSDIVEALENVEETSEIDLTVGGEEETSAIESTRAALVDFVCARLGKKLNKGE